MAGCRCSSSTVGRSGYAPTEGTTDGNAPSATAIAGRTAALLRDARSVERRLDT
ncbi:MAG: hypothetical protein ACYDEA_07185 [Candidatus Dormibacteria bacterium]